MLLVLGAFWEGLTWRVEKLASSRQSFCGREAFFVRMAMVCFSAAKPCSSPPPVWGRVRVG